MDHSVCTLDELGRLLVPKIRLQEIGWKQGMGLGLNIIREQKAIGVFALPNAASPLDFLRRIKIPPHILQDFNWVVGDKLRVYAEGETVIITHSPPEAL